MVDPIDPTDPNDAAVTAVPLANRGRSLDFLERTCGACAEHACLECTCRDSVERRRTGV
jgi:hypothetical protein